jgi:hypothetical protein
MTMEKNRKLRPERLDDFKNLYYDAFGYGDGKHERASEFFGVPVSECKLWHDTKPHPVAHRYLQVHCKGYLPFNTNWKECRIMPDGMVMTPFGNCMPSDMALLHRRKWSAEQTRQQLVRCRQQLHDLRSGVKMKMLIHTADYLNRLLRELTEEL